MSEPPASITFGLPLPPGDWAVACGVWVFIPTQASHTDLSYAIRLLQRIELDRMADGERYDALTR